MLCEVVAHGLRRPWPQAMSSLRGWPMNQLKPDVIAVNHVVTACAEALQWILGLGNTSCVLLSHIKLNTV